MRRQDKLTPWKRRRTMVYTEDTGSPGSAQCICECQTVEQANAVVKDHNRHHAVIEPLREIADYGNLRDNPHPMSTLMVQLTSEDCADIARNALKALED